MVASQAKCNRKSEHHASYIIRNSSNRGMIATVNANIFKHNHCLQQMPTTVSQVMAKSQVEALVRNPFFMSDQQKLPLQRLAGNHKKSVLALLSPCDIQNIVMIEGNFCPLKKEKHLKLAQDLLKWPGTLSSRMFLDHCFISLPENVSKIIQRDENFGFKKP